MDFPKFINALISIQTESKKTFFCKELFINMTNDERVISFIEYDFTETKYASYYLKKNRRKFTHIAKRLFTSPSPAKFKSFLEERSPQIAQKDKLLNSFKEDLPDINGTNLYAMITLTFFNIIGAELGYTPISTLEEINIDAIEINENSDDYTCNTTTENDDSSDNQENFESEKVDDVNENSDEGTCNTTTENDNSSNNQEDFESEKVNVIFSCDNNSVVIPDSIISDTVIPYSDKKEILEIANNILENIGGIRKAAVNCYFKTYTSIDGSKREDYIQLKEQFDNYYSKIDSLNNKLYRYLMMFPNFKELDELYYKYAQIIKSDFELKYRSEENNVYISPIVNEYSNLLLKFITDLSK